jgi:putative ABC transport system ATP-binding protein
MIQLSHIAKTFNKGSVNEVHALNDVSLHIPRGEFAVVIGTNGSGKSTLFNILAGAERADSGSIHISGIDAGRIPEHKRAQWVARVFQNPLSGTAPDLSILDNFRLAALRTKKKGFTIGTNSAFRKLVQDRIATLGMGLESKVDQPMGTLSGGQRQALTLLMSVMDHTSLLLLDEPTAALDPRSAHTVMETAGKLITEYQLTALLITHDLKQAWQYGNRLVQMREGTIVRDLTATAKAALQPQEMYEWF